MKNLVCISQDSVSNALSVPFIAENEKTVLRMIKNSFDSIPESERYIIKDTVIFKVGELILDDDSGLFQFVSYPNPVMICRGSQFVGGVSCDENYI